MSAEDFIPPPIPEELLPPEEWYEPYLKFGLYVGAAFQLVCILALIFLPPTTKEKGSQSEGFLFQGDSSSEEEEEEDEEEDEMNQTKQRQRQNNKKKSEKKKKRL